MSENSGFPHVRHIIIIHHGYLINIDKLLYYNTVVALSIGYNATSANMRRKTFVSEEDIWRNRRRPKKTSSFKSHFGEFPGHVESMYNVLRVVNHEQCSIVYAN